MARILISVVPASGHVNPIIAVAKALREQGHDVLIATDESYRLQLERADLNFTPLPYPDGAVKRILEAFLKPARWMSQLQFKPPQAYFLDYLDILVDGLIAVVHDFKPDALLTDQNFYAGAIAADVCKLPYASFCAIVNTLFTRDAPPYGLGSDWVPCGDWQRLLWIGLRLSVYAVLWRHDRVVNAIRKRYGLSAVKWDMLEQSPYLAIVPTTEAYEYPRQNVPSQMMYVGPVTAIARGETYDDFPWDWLENDDRPTLYVSMGTVVGGLNVFREVIDVARGASWKAILAVGRDTDLNQFADAPDNVLLQNYVPQLKLLDHVDAVISHGGNNTVTDTLLHGLPLIVIPFSADQPESAGRVRASGAGIRIRPAKAKGNRLRKAIAAILNDPSYRREAQRIQKSYTACEGPRTAARLIGHLAETQQAIHRPEGMSETIFPDDLDQILEK
jgi:MGT family glycosyltransferase